MDIQILSKYENSVTRKMREMARVQIDQVLQKTPEIDDPFGYFLVDETHAALCFLHSELYTATPAAIEIEDTGQLTINRNATQPNVYILEIIEEYRLEENAAYFSMKVFEELKNFGSEPD